MNLKELERKRTDLAHERDRYDRDEPEYDKLSDEISKLSQEINRELIAIQVKTLRSGLQPFYRFIHNGFLESDFTPLVYRMLNRCFGNIAHFDRHTFYVVKFAADNIVIDTLQRMVDTRNPTELEEDIIDMVNESRILVKLKSEK